MITIATIVFYTTTKKEQALRREKSLYYIYKHYSSHDTWHQLLHTTDNRTTTRKATSIFEAYWRKKEKKRIKPLNRPKRKAAMNNQKLRPGKLSPNYATVWVAMGQREGTVFPFCSKFFFQIFLFHILIYVILLLSPIYISYRMSWGKMDGIICLWPTEGFKFLSRLLVIYNPELCPFTDECPIFIL